MIAGHERGPSASSGPLCEAYDVALLDLDGVVYVGSEAVPEAVAALSAATGSGMRLAYVTNNASRPPMVVRDHLRGFGLAVDVDDVITSAQGAAAMLVDHVPPGSVVAAVGGPGVADALDAAGFLPVGADDESAVALVMGFGPDVSWRELSSAAFAVARGAVFVATNTDRTIPTPKGIAPGNGMFVEAVARAGGRDPLVAGKPEPTLFVVAIDRMASSRPLVIGDRLDTDIEGAARAGVDSLLVLTGVTTAAEAVLAPPESRPTFLAHDLRGLLDTHQAPVVDADGSHVCGSWSARVRAGEHGRVVHVSHVSQARPGIQRSARDEHEDRADAVRAACSAAWTSDHQVVDVVGLP